MPVMIEEVTLAKSQKSWRVKLSGKWYGAYKDSGITPDLKGTWIEAEIEVTDKAGPWIMKWTRSATVAQPAPAQPSSAPPPPPPPPLRPAAAGAEPASQPAAPKYAEPTPPDAQHFREMCIFMSGAVNHAIAAGKVETPNAIGLWALGAKRAFLAALAAGKGGDDDIPF